MKDAPTIVSEIDDLLRDFWVHIDNPENLSKDILKLSVLNGGLGNWLADALNEERYCEANYKHGLDKRKLEIMATEKDDKGKAVSDQMFLRGDGKLYVDYDEDGTSLVEWPVQLATGIRDHLGREIYEGDIVKGAETSWQETGEVKWYLQWCGFGVKWLWLSNQPPGRHHAAA